MVNALGRLAWFIRVAAPPSLIRQLHQSAQRVVLRYTRGVHGLYGMRKMY